MTARRFLRSSASILGVLLVALLLGGCVEVQMESEFNDDGSARHVLVTTIDRDGLDQLESVGGEGTTTFDPEQGREQAEAAGFEFTPIDNDEKVGSRIAKTFENGEQVGAAFDEMFNAFATEGSTPAIGAVTGTYVKDGDEYRLDLTINSDILFEDSGATDEAADSGFGDLSSFIDMTYVATMPGDIKETNGEDLGDGKIQWELPLTGTTEITAVSETGSGGSAGMIAVIGLVALLLVGGLVGGYLFTRRRTPAPASTPVAQPSPYEPIPASEQDTTRLPEPDATS